MKGGGEEARDGEAALLSGAKATPRPAVEVRWLGFLLVETVLLLVFQVAAGLLTGSLALLADSPHSCADVISYGINFFVERRKSAASSRTLERWSLATSFFSVAHIDLFGSGISTLLLCVATWFTSVEAAQRLRSASSAPQHKAGGVDEGASEFRGIGPALLAFAVLSTVANLGTLLVYQRWQAAAKTPPAPATEPEALPPPAPAAPVAAPPAIQMKVLAAPGPPGLAKKTGLNPYTDFASLEASFEASLEAGMCMPCAETPTATTLAATPRLQCFDGCGACPAGPGGSPNWSSTLHRIVHPGCTGDHGGFQGDAGAEPAAPAANLNVTSAMLHLVADVLRGLTILVAAVAIETGCVSDAGKADAVCALFVAGFVALGSLALLRRLAAALWSEFGGRLKAQG